MKRNLLIILSLFMALTLSTGFAFAQGAAPASVESDQSSEELEPVLGYSDYTIKGYTLTFFGGQFSGAKYLENQRLAPRAVFTEGANDIMSYDGEVLDESKDYNHWDAAHKEIEAGPAYGARLGVYISDNFHLDVIGVYGTGRANITMLQIATLDDDPDFVETRQELNADDDFKMYKGGLAFQYDGNGAKVWGVRPRLGFGLGGVINRFSELSDVTALYLDGYFALDYPLTDKMDISAGVDISTFAFKVEELGYSNMVTYNTFHVGLTFFMDVLPGSVRASHIAELEKKK